MEEVVMETKELIEQLCSCGERNCPVCPDVESCTGPSLLMLKAAARLVTLEKKYATAVKMAAIATELAAKFRKWDGDLISRSELLGTESLLMTDIVESDPVAKFVLEQVLHDIKAAPAVPAEPIVHAHWEDMYGGKYANPRYRCSACKEKANWKSEQDELLSWHEVQVLTPICHNCGAHMDEEVADGLYCAE